MDDRRRFFDLLPFYVNGTLQENDFTWMRHYLQENPQLRPQVGLQESIRASLQETVAASIADMPPDLGFDRTITRIRAAEAAMPPREGRMQRFLAWLIGRGSDGRWRLAPALVLALAVIGVQGVLLFERQMPTYGEVRGTAPALADGPLLRVNFKPEAREADIRLTLIEARALIVAGPTRLGDYYLKTAPGQLAAVKLALSGSGLIQEIDEVPGLPEELLE